MLLCVRLPQQCPPSLLMRMELLSPAWRRQKAAQLTAQVRLRSLAAGLLLELALRRAGVEGGSGHDEAGRPRPARGVPPYASLSHSGNYAACALFERRVGVDVQQVVTVHPRLPQRVCAPQELSALASCGNPALRFAALWTLKEAYLKTVETTDPIGFIRQSAFSLPDGWETSDALLEATGPAGYRHQLCRLADDYFLALCTAEQAD